MSLNCWLFSQVNLPTILLLMIIRSLAYCSYHHTSYKTAFTLSAQILSINVNKPFFQVPILEFGHSAGAQVQGLGLVLGHKSRHWVPIGTQFL